MSNAIRNCTFSFKSYMSWEDLKHAANPDIRFFESCQRDGYFSHTADQLKDAIVFNRCVSIEIINKVGQIFQLTGSSIRNSRDDDDNQLF